MRSPRVTSRWGRPTAERWLATWAHEPVLVAESLRSLSDPLDPILGGCPPAPARGVVAAIARALLPAMAPDSPPAWLRANQVMAFRRTLATLRRYGGGLLAEPVGTGKTWIALAAAQALSPRHPVVLAPAALRGQWQAAAATAGLAVQVHTHETVSRGRLPAGDCDLALVDESHWYRMAATRRYRALAPWLAGRRCLLVSATPIVNQPADLAHQLRLCLRDDALSAAGLRSLRTLHGESAGLEALGEVVIAGCSHGGERPALSRTSERVRGDRGLTRILRELDRLGLSTDPATVALVRTSLWGAAASSPAALSAALLRYLALLDHAEDAARTGRNLGREALRQFIAADSAQLVLWELFPTGPDSGDLVLGDRAAARALRNEVARRAEHPDPKVIALRRLLADGRRTLVFVSAIATVGYLRRHLGAGPIAWCSGARAGIGPTVLPREAVLAWFAPGESTVAIPGLSTPRVLVATDVAAEGLDLQGAERVVHYDLPWTAVRTEQRAGRVHRLGSPHPRVAEHWILPPSLVAARLGVEATIARKRALPLGMGIGEASPAWWRRRQEAVQHLPTEGATEGASRVAMPAALLGDDDAVAGIRISVGPTGGVTRLLVHGAGSGWRFDEARALRLLELAREARSPRHGDPCFPTALVESLAEPVRNALREAAGRHWDPGSLSPGQSRLLRRLRHWARIAARARDGKLLEQLDHAVRGLGQGMTAGDEIRLAQLAARGDATLQEHLTVLPRIGPLLTIPTVRLVGLLGLEAGE